MTKRHLIAALLACAAWTAPAAADPIRDGVRQDMPSLLELYRHLHANPELSLQEERTAARMAQEVRRLGFRVTTGVGGHGVVAVMENGPGPVVLLRADMDGLPVEEQTGLPFASRVRATSTAGTESGVMHACAHDTHMAAWVGAARRLAAMKDRWSGTLVMIAQPAEEIGVGARAMLEDGLYTRFPKPTHAISFHNSATLPAGQIGYSIGPALANVDTVDIRIRGVGGHGAAPHTTRDPVVLGARIVGTLQTLVSRELNPLDPAVVTVGSFQAGTKHNIISDEAVLLLTVRSYTPETRRLLLDGIRRIARGEAIAAGIPDDRMPEVTIREGEYTPATLNTEALTRSSADLFRERFGEERVMQVPPVMAGEDFGRYHLADPSVESLIFWVGGVPQAKWDEVAGDTSRLPSLHSPFWAPDPEPTIATAAEAMVAAALGVFGR
ncbi:MAG: amidohydrolase [Allosphingosinicella sp.]|uniref:amidohydrolase n=1 Tax=Allosphingosinicella sp. TaxID=2823234 RepID=UPI00395438B4